MRRFVVLLALLVVASLGSAVHREASWAPTRIGERYVLEGDLHVHSSFAGALPTPIDLPLLARRQRLDFIAVTEHNAWFGGALTRSFARLLAPDLVVLPSEEITNRAYHLLAIGLTERIDPQRPLHGIAEEAHRQGGVVLAAHPTRDTWPLLLGLADQHLLDGGELFHPTMLRDPAVAAEYEAFLTEASRRSGRELARVGDSDFHGGSRIGLVRTLVLADTPTAAGILDALRAGRVVAATEDGRLGGDAETLAALADAHYLTRARTVTAPSPRGALEHVLRWLGFAVMLAATLRGALARQVTRRRRRSR